MAVFCGLFHDKGYKVIYNMADLGLVILWCMRCVYLLPPLAVE